jgi:hypothetical protein
MQISNRCKSHAVVQSEGNCHVENRCRKGLFWSAPQITLLGELSEEQRKTAAANRTSLPGASNADFEDCDPQCASGRLSVNRGLWKGSTWLAVRSLLFEAKWL